MCNVASMSTANSGLLASTTMPIIVWLAKVSSDPPPRYMRNIFFLPLPASGLRKHCAKRLERHAFVSHTSPNSSWPSSALCRICTYDSGQLEGGGVGLCAVKTLDVVGGGGVALIEGVVKGPLLLILGLLLPGGLHQR
eukprot:4911027-Amphidinium_carterae.1